MSSSYRYSYKHLLVLLSYIIALNNGSSISVVAAPSSIDLSTNENKSNMDSSSLEYLSHSMDRKMMKRPTPPMQENLQSSNQLHMSHSSSKFSIPRHLSFSCPNATWSQIGSDIDGERVDDQSGHSVSLSANGTIMAIGAHLNDDGGYNGGHVRVFREDPTSPKGWTQIGQDIDAEGPTDHFGFFSAVLSDDGTILAVGARRNDGAPGVWSGHARVFQFDGSNWFQIGRDIDGASAYDEAGSYLDLSGNGDIVAIGSPLNDDGGNRAGHVRIYKRNPSLYLGWELLGQPLIGEAPEDQSGWSVALSHTGLIVAVGALLNDGNGVDSGHVRVFQYIASNNTWVQLGDDIDGEAAGDRSGYGHSISLSDSGDILAVGADSNDGNGVDSGHVRVFYFNSTSQSWIQRGNDIDGESAGDFSGHTVRLSGSGDLVAIGAHLNDENGLDAGHVRAYRYDESTLEWVKVGHDIDGEAAGDLSGYTLALSKSGKVMAIGAVFNAGNGYRSGHVRVYRACNETLYTDEPSDEPSSLPSFQPSTPPSETPSNIPTNIPSVVLSSKPSLDPHSWDLRLHTPGYLVTPPMKDGTQYFVTKYDMSERAYAIEVFKTDCSTSSTGLPLINSTLISNTLDVTFIYNQTTIQASNLWTANSTGGDVDFCIKVSLFSDDDLILFNFIETTYKIEVDLTTGFSTNVDIIRTQAGNGGVEIIDVEENVTAYQCDESFQQIQSPLPLTQGDSLQICVETEDGSVFEVEKVKDVTISQNGTKSFDYVSSYASSYWADILCIAVNTTASKCKIKMQLLGTYFSDDNPADLSVIGEVKLDYLGRRRMYVDHAEYEEDGDSNARPPSTKHQRMALSENEKSSVFFLSVDIDGSESQSSSSIVEDDVGDSQQATSTEEAIESGVASPSSLFYGSILAIMIAVLANVAV